jgi:diguanylate cyclase (GGDEF)-like protein
VLQDVNERLQLDLRTAASTSGGPGLPRAVSDSYAALRTTLTPYLTDTAPTGTAPTGTAPTGTAPTGPAPTSTAAGGAGYLALALYRATTRDVGTVLTEINRVTNGEFDWGEPLTGRDEFAQMSRAVKDTSDRLTELLSALRLQATYDELTALPNRTMFMAKVEDSIAERPGSFAVVLADLERFKDINDSFGHGIGDRLLHVVSARFHRAAGRRNLVARLGGNEFAVLVYDATTIRDVQQVIARMQVALTEPVDIDGRQLHTRARMGIALHATGRPGAVELIRNADVALSAAKGRDGVVVTLFEPAMHEHTRDRTELSGDLVTAVAEQQFSLVYQPIADVASGSVQGVEALVRWMHPSGRSRPRCSSRWPRHRDRSSSSAVGCCTSRCNSWPPGTGSSRTATRWPWTSTCPPTSSPPPDCPARF